MFLAIAFSFPRARCVDGPKCAVFLKATSSDSVSSLTVVTLANAPRLDIKAEERSDDDGGEGPEVAPHSGVTHV